MLLVLILSKQFTTHWPGVVRSGDERSALPAAVEQLACVYFENEPGRQSSKVMRASSDVRFWG
jgi:hypothetical protein